MKLIAPGKVRQRGGAFTLLEMLTTVAALVIVLGLMMSLARRVRDEAAIDLTKDLLRRLDRLMDVYEARYSQLPAISPVVNSTVTEPQEEALQRNALKNNRELMAVLRSDFAAASDAFNGLPEDVWTDATLLDAWKTPIAYMPALHPAIGMAPQNRRFFFSAGPDRKFLTQEDNLYSYEESSARVKR